MLSAPKVLHPADHCSAMEPRLIDGRLSCPSFSWTTKVKLLILPHEWAQPAAKKNIFHNQVNQGKSRARTLFARQPAYYLTH